MATRARELAGQIIAAQLREIEEMRLLPDDIARNGEEGAAALPACDATLTPEMAEAARRVLE